MAWLYGLRGAIGNERDRRRGCAVLLESASILVLRTAHCAWGGHFVTCIPLWPALPMVGMTNRLAMIVPTSGVLRWSVALGGNGVVGMSLKGNGEIRSCRDGKGLRSGQRALVKSCADAADSRWASTLLFRANGKKTADRWRQSLTKQSQGHCQRVSVRHMRSVARAISACVRQCRPKG